MTETSRFIRSPFLGRFAALATALLVAACDLPAPGPGRGVDPSAPVTVALMLPMDAADPAAAALGRDLAAAARLAAGDVNGAVLNLRLYAADNDPAAAAAAARTALDEGAAIILGPLYGGDAAAVGPIAAAGGVQVFSFSNNAAVAGANVWVLGTGYRDTAERVVQYARDDGATRIGVAYPEGIDGDTANAAAVAAIAASGGALAASVSYPLSAEGITETAPAIATTMRGAGAEALVLTDGPTQGLTYLTEVLRGTGLRDTRFVGLQRWDLGERTLSQPGLQGGVFAGPDPALSALFAQRFRDAYGHDPHPLAGLAYDGVAAIGALVAEARADGAADPFSDERLTQPQGFAGVAGIFRFRPDNTAERGLAVFRVESGEAVLVSPAPRRFAEEFQYGGA